MVLLASRLRNPIPRPNGPGKTTVGERGRVSRGQVNRGRHHPKRGMKSVMKRLRKAMRVIFAGVMLLAVLALIVFVWTGGRKTAGFTR